MVTIIRRAGVAQSAERLTRNEQVRGSIPLSGSGIPPRPLPGKSGNRRTGAEDVAVGWQSTKAWDHGG